MRALIPLSIVSLALATGCGGDEAAPATARAVSADSAVAADESLNALNLPRDARIKITLRGKDFTPKYLQAHPGQTLVFTNRGTIDHDLRATFGLAWSSGRLRPGDTYELKLEREDPAGGETGMYWVCDLHPVMTGTVIFPD
jgi:plastocyanin